MVEREKYFQLLKEFKDKQIIKVITGIRRCGKSTLLELFQNYLRKEGIKEEQIISINFENPDNEILLDRKELYEYIKKRLSKDKMTYVFLDEIQNVLEFEKTVDGLFIKKNVDLYITGSNAYLLSSELATLLTGRFIEIKMLPLSFKEYLEFFEDKKDLEEKFNNYLRYSSFPQAVDFYKINPLNIDLYLDGIFSTILYKDIMTRKDISDQMTLTKVITYLYDNIGNSCSIKKISDTLTLNGNIASYNTIANYIEALIDSYLLYKATRYDIKRKEHLKTQEKYYAVDIGFRYHLLGSKAGSNQGRILENVIYLELLRRGYKVYVGKIDDLEIDFIATNANETIYYQVSLSVRDEKTLERELAPLKKVNDNYPKVLLTMDRDPKADYDGIKKINIIDFLLEK